MQSLHGLDRLRTGFDDERLVAHAGLLLPATLAAHLGLRELVDEHVDLGSAPGRANAGDKILTLVMSALAGGDCDNVFEMVAGWFSLESLAELSARMSALAADFS